MPAGWEEARRGACASSQDAAFTSAQRPSASPRPTASRNPRVRSRQAISVDLCVQCFVSMGAAEVGHLTYPWQWQSCIETSGDPQHRQHGVVRPSIRRSPANMTRTKKRVTFAPNLPTHRSAIFRQKQRLALLQLRSYVAKRQGPPPSPPSAGTRMTEVSQTLVVRCCRPVLIACAWLMQWLRCRVRF